MSGSDELYPPAQYGWGWLLLAFGVLALLVAAVWLVILLTRQRRLAPPVDLGATMPRTADVLSQLREEYLARIAAIESEYRAGALDPRRANLELSRAVRTFVNEYSGLEAPVLALDDLISLGVHPALIDALHRHYYPSIFRQGPAIDPIAGVEAARRVVTSWH